MSELVGRAAEPSDAVAGVVPKVVYTPASTAAPAAVRKQIDVWGPPPSAFQLIRRIKDRFDPNARLNPGRFVGGL